MATTRSNPSSSAGSQSYLIPFIIVTVLFGAFGFLTNLNSNLSPKLEDIFNLDHAWSNLVATSWFFAYLVFSVPAARLIQAVGYKRTMVISLFVMTAGALLFVPAANLVSFPLFLTASFVLATGVCGLQTSANPYVSILGPEHSAPAPIVVVHFILTNSSKTDTQASVAHTVEGPYLAIAAALFVLGVAILFMHLPAITSAGRCMNRIATPSTKSAAAMARYGPSTVWATLACVSVLLEFVRMK